jgi:Flp pilus assembly protein TadG
MARVKKFLKRWLSDEGAELIEYALVLPMLLLVVLGIAEFGYMFMRY